jgi:hypothetical protein
MNSNSDTSISSVPSSDASKPDEPRNAAAHARMDPEVKATWLAALRSGEYQQVRDLLRAPEPKNAYCCLGVLCAITPGVTWDKDGDAIYREVEADGELPSPLRKKVGIRIPTIRQLIGMNDGKGMRPHSFTEIADWIEANL